MGWIVPAEAVRSVRPQTRRQPSRGPVAVGGLIALTGLIGGVIAGVYLSTHPVIRDHPQALALQVATPQIRTPQQATSPPAARPVEAAPVTEPPAPVTPPAQRVAALAPPSEARPIATRPTPQDIDQQAHSLAAACERGAACGAEAVARAKRLVADAYQTAVRSGAPSSTLDEYHRRWNDLLGDSEDSPPILIGNYTVLAHDLNAVARASKPSPRNHRSAETPQ